MNALTDYDIQALVDDELDHEQAKKVRSQLEKNQSWKKRYDELLEQKKLLKLWWKNTNFL